jgi:hypothetical protein
MQAQGLAWPEGQRNPVNIQPSLEYIKKQKFAISARKTDTSSLSVCSGTNGGPRTAPDPSIPTVLKRLEEDFDNYRITKSQEPLFAARDGDNILAQIGMMDQLQPDVQEEALIVQKDEPKMPTSTLSVDEIGSFLQGYIPTERINFLASAVQGTVQSLQSRYWNKAIDIAPAASGLDKGNFGSSVPDGDLAYCCPFPGCSKATPSMNELSYHIKRHDSGGDQAFHISTKSDSDPGYVASCDMTRPVTNSIQFAPMAGHELDLYDFNPENPVLNHGTEPQQIKDSLECKKEGCGYKIRTKSDFRYVSRGPIDRSQC